MLQTKAAAWADAETPRIPNSQEITNVQRSCSKALRLNKRDLQISLKLLAMWHQGAQGEKGELTRKVDDEPSLPWLSDAGGDELYFEMVMLNSSLLKALHVVDSFHAHCNRDLPHGLLMHDSEIRLQEDSVNFPLYGDMEGDECGSEKDKFADSFDTDCYVGVGATQGDAAAGAGVDVILQNCSRTVTGREYRRLQGQCDVQEEAVRSAEQQRRCDIARLSRLEEECRQLQSTWDRLRRQPLDSAAPIASTFEDDELQLCGQAIRVSRKTNLNGSLSGRTLVSYAEMQKLISRTQYLRRAVKDNRTVIASHITRSDVAALASSEAVYEEQELRRLLDCGSNEDLEAAVEKLERDVADMGFDGLSAASTSAEHRAEDCASLSQGTATSSTVPAPLRSPSAPSAPTAQVPDLSQLGYCSTDRDDQRLEFNDVSAATATSSTQTLSPQPTIPVVSAAAAVHARVLSAEDSAHSSRNASPCDPCHHLQKKAAQPPTQQQVLFQQPAMVSSPAAAAHSRLRPCVGYGVRSTVAATRRRWS